MARENEPGMPKSKKTGTGRWTKYQPAQPKIKATWGNVDAVLLLNAIEEVTADGAALLIGATRDGGALVLTICDGDERLKLYASSTEEMHEHLHGILKA